MTRELQEKLESYQRVWAEVDLDAIWENMVHMKENIAEKTKILAVIKTDGYGHGGVPIAKMLEQLDFMFGYAAATYEEAHVLREAGVKKPILILGYTFPYCYEELIREEIRPAVLRALEVMKTRTPLPLTWEPEVPALVAQGCGGDVRKSINAVELLCEAAVPKDGTLLLTEADAKALSQRSAMRYDRGGDAMYDAASALHKSIRGSDPDAALHYLARFLEAGDLITPCRRLLCAASEDVGLAYPQAITIVKSCVDTAMQLGLPEAQLPLAQAAILLATAPKSNSVCTGIMSAWADVKAGRGGDVPRELQNVHADSAGLEREQGYKYPHNYGHHWVRQQYLPDAIKNARYYHYGDNKTEQAAKSYWEKIKGPQ